jgi:fatty acid desaturase
VEHNNRHHYNLSEIHDPDLVEQNLAGLRSRQWPTALKYVQVVLAAAVWKWYYYAPNTYKELKLASWRREGKKIPAGVQPEMPVVIDTIFMGQNPFYTAVEFLSVVLGPYLLFHFFLTPLPWYFAGQYFAGYTGAQMYWNAVTNLFLADILTNLHGFLCVVTNHAGDDMYRFSSPCRPFSGSFCLRQVLASVDYDYGSDLVDFLHGYLNYQVEHHLWPNLSMRSYQKAAPRVRDICGKYGVPYVQHNVFYRLKKTVEIMVGTTSMRQFPLHYEQAFLEIDALKETMKDTQK